jgi:multidrug resistance efflux pump
MLKGSSRFLLTVVIVVAASAAGYELSDYYMWSPWTRDAHVPADVVTVAPDVAGFVTDLRVRDTQFVHKGDVLMIID